MSHGRYERQKPKKKGGKTVLIVLAVVAALLIALVIGGVAYYNSILNKIPRAEHVDKNPSDEDIANAIGGQMPTDWDQGGEWKSPETTAPTETVPETTVPETRPPMKPEDLVNVLVVGQSARKGESGHMADSTILVTVNKYDKTVRLTSVFRDTFVHRGGVYKGKTFGGNKFTSVYAWGYSVGDIGGAMDCINQVMLNNFGVEVDHNLEIDFNFVENFINKLGGVSLELTQAEADYMNETMEGYCEVTEGKNWFDGPMTLVYARMRKDKDANESDIKRAERQRYLIERILHQMKKKSLPEIQALIDETLPYIVTNMENDEITKLIMDLLPMLPTLKIESGTLPVDGTYWGETIDIYDDGIPDSVLKFNPEQQKELMRPITEGEFE